MCHYRNKPENLRETPRRPGLVLVGGQSVQWQRAACSFSVFHISQFLLFWYVNQSYFKMYQGDDYLRKCGNKFFNTSIFLECELIDISGSPGILYNHSIKCVNLCQESQTRYRNLL